MLAWFYREPRLKDITFLAVSDVSHRRSEGTARCASQAPDAVFIPSYSGCGFLCSSCSCCHHTGLARSWLLGVSRSSPDIELDSNVAFLVDGPLEPGLPRRDAKVRSLIAFGGNVAASYLIFNVNRSADSVLIGWYWGAGPLGLYSRAYNLLMLPVRQLGAPARSVAVPAFSRVQDDPERFARYYLRAANLIMWISAPIFGFLFVAAEPVIVLALGNRWREAAPVFQILAIFALGQLLLESTLWLFVSRGQSKRLLKLLLIISPIIIGSYAIGLPFGIKGVALSGSLVLLAIFPWILKFAFRGTTLTLRRLGQAILYPISRASLVFFWRNLPYT